MSIFTEFRMQKQNISVSICKSQKYILSENQSDFSNNSYLETNFSYSITPLAQHDWTSSSYHTISEHHIRTETMFNPRGRVVHPAESQAEHKLPCYQSDCTQNRNHYYIPWQARGHYCIPWQGQRSLLYLVTRLEDTIVFRDNAKGQYCISWQG